MFYLIGKTQSYIDALPTNLDTMKKVVKYGNELMDDYNNFKVTTENLREQGVWNGFNRVTFKCLRDENANIVMKNFNGIFSYCYDNPKGELVLGFNNFEVTCDYENYNVEQMMNTLLMRLEEK